MKTTASIIVPTFNNPQYFNPCVESIARTGCLDGLCELIVVNNGKQPMDFLSKWPNTKVIQPGTNLGWERGLQAGMEVAQGDFLCFQNDDTLIPRATANFYSQMLWPFNNQNVAAVGPATTVAAGWHSVYQQSALRTLTEVSFLIFFTVMIRRSHLEAVGGIDTSAPGGDDFDLSIRFRKKGFKLLINPDAFLIHHAFKTGERVRGTSDKPDGWNSKEMIERTNRWLIQKHGFKDFLETMRGFSYVPGEMPPDVEGDTCAQFVRGAKVVEIACGFRKTVPQAIGIDHCGPNENPTNLHDGKKSVADIVADVTKPLPIDPLSVDTAVARHTLEHCVDIIETLTNWNRILKMGGRLIIAVPNEQILISIPLNPEHVHAFTPNSLRAVVQLCGFKQIETRDPKNGISFVSCFEKVKHPDPIEQEKKLEPLHV